MLKRIRKKNDFPAVSKYLVEINKKLSSNPDSFDASGLADVILKDYALTNKLLKLVNSAFYGRAAGRISTVTRAVVVLGYENVRLAAISLVLFEHYKNKINAANLKEAVASAFWSGVLSQSIAETDGRIDPEEAYVCAMMSSLGKMIMMNYLPEEYHKIDQRMLTNADDETKAAKIATGVSYEELGAAVARLWNFPLQICEAMQPLSKDDLKNKKKPPSRLWALTSFVRELTGVIQEHGLERSKKRLKDLIDSYQSRFAISHRQLKVSIKDSIAKVQQYARVMDIDFGNSSFLRKLSFDTPPPAQEPPPAGDQSFQLTGTDDLKTSSAGSGGQDAKDIIMGGIQEISETMMADYDVNDIAIMSLEIIYRSLGFQRALLFLRSGDSRMLKARFGYGANCRQLIHKLGFALNGGRNLFNHSIKLGKDLIVANACDEKIRSLIPQWYHDHIGAPAFILLPMAAQNVCVGAFYADRAKEGQPISKTEHRLLSMLRNHLLLAIKYQAVCAEKDRP
jgi:HD-like signal output (HDOD) protein